MMVTSSTGHDCDEEDDHDTDKVTSSACTSSLRGFVVVIEMMTMTMMTRVLNRSTINQSINCKG